MKQLILIYPPAAKICEPPLGVAILAGALKKHNIKCKVIDANLDAMLWLARCSSNISSSVKNHSPQMPSKSSPSQPFSSSSQIPSPPPSVWHKRAVSNLERNISDLKDISIYKNISKYRQRVIDLNKALTISLENPIFLEKRFKISLSDYSDSNLTPVKSQDLLISAKYFMENPFYPFFETYLAKEIECFFDDNIFPSNSIDPTQAADSDFIGISLCYLSQALTAFALAGWIKKRFPNKKIIMGGGLVTSWMSMPDWNEPFKDLVDIMVKGRGEEVLIKLCRESKDKSNKRKSLDNRVQEEKLNNYKETLNSCCIPDFDFCKWDQYIAPKRIIPFRTSTGCYWNKCRFCPEKAEGSRYKPEKKSSILESLQYIVNKYNPDYIHFIDDAVPPSFLKTLASLNFSVSSDSPVSSNPLDLINNTPKSLPNPDSFKNSFKWYGFVRFTKELADPQFCKALYNSGCRLLKLGLESGDQDVLNLMNKGTDLDSASNVLLSLKNAGIAAYIYLLFGTQFEDELKAQKTLDYVIAHKELISFLNIAIFNLPRFSRDAEELQTSLFSDGDLSLYLNFKHPLNWDRKKVRKFVDQKFKKNPAIAEILKNDPLFFTSNHAVFFI